MKFEILMEPLPFEQSDVVESDTGELRQNPTIVRTSKFAPKPMSLDEAVDQMTLNQLGIIVFLNSHTDVVNVLYRHADGNLELIEPE